ncbi:hypothetical protein [Pseudodesulfovibrio sp.]|uniref:hypothetical protein n=1 Tax=Pseudodesulfovibrio sp. TaxID=2035812 RepID=UPI0026337ABA|nr:hypothetical protein [Pseudodesulfovibrio sp.]MDD3313184.1 hypothetical protein [Pseudodesulfovibrio sp.]
MTRIPEEKPSVPGELSPLGAFEEAQESARLYVDDGFSIEVGSRRAHELRSRAKLGARPNPKWEAMREKYDIP